MLKWEEREGKEAFPTCLFGFLTASGKKVPMGGGRSRCEPQPSHSGEQVRLQSHTSCPGGGLPVHSFMRPIWTLASSLGVSHTISDLSFEFVCGLVGKHWVLCDP